jgi:anaerobic magnesium-protoporphyrin IX monomethyl ester cyclase
MKILMINPFQSHLVNKRGNIYNRVCPPLSEANCAALLEGEGHNVVLIDANAERLSPAEVVSRASGFDKIFITSSPLYSWQCPPIDLAPFLSYVKALRKVSNEIYVIGVHGTVRPQEMLELTGAKAVIRGEPEFTVLDICRNSDLSKIRGLSFLTDGGLVDNDPRDPLDLETLPMPSFHLLPMKKYFYEVLGRNFVLLEASRGCLSRCSFCLRTMHGNSVRVKSARKLIDEIETVIEKYHVRNAYFYDLEFTFNRGLVEEVCDHLIRKKYDFKWTCQTRFDLIDEELLGKMQRAGCDLIHFGVEAASDKALRALGKGITVDKIQAGMKMMKKLNMRSACFFLIGAFDSTEKDVQEIIKFSMKLNPTYALFHIAIPYPGTKFYEDVSENGGFFSDSNIFPEAYVGKMPLEKIKTLTRNAYIKYYLRPRYILSIIRRGQLKYLYRQVKLFYGFIS